MVLQATRAGLQAIIEGYFSGVDCQLILLNESDALTDTATIVDFISLEPSTADGYQRQEVIPTLWAWDGSTSAIRSAPVSATYTAGVAGTIQFDAAALLVNGGMTANAEVTSITTNVFTAAGHGLAANDKVIFTDAVAAPSGITLGTVYYVIAPGLTTDTFQISATMAGSVLSVSPTFTGPLIVRSANGTIVCWEQRPDDGAGNRVYVINAGQSHSVQFQLGQRVGS